MGPVSGMARKFIYHHPFDPLNSLPVITSFSHDRWTLPGDDPALKYTGFTQRQRLGSPTTYASTTVGDKAYMSWNGEHAFSDPTNVSDLFASRRFCGPVVRTMRAIQWACTRSN